MPAISVIMPVYKVEQYLAECLDSVLAQTMKDIEIICVNDGSPDDSQAILEAYAARDPRIKVIVQENAGPSAARNTGVRQATGEYIYYVDPDDVIEPNTCEVLWQHIEATQADIVVFGMDDIIENPSTDPWFIHVSSPREVFYAAFDPYALLYEPGAFPFTWRNIYRRGMLLKHGIEYDESLRLGEDVVYQFTAFPHARRIQFIPDKLYHYRRMRKDSLTKNAHEHMFDMVMNHVDMVGNIKKAWQKKNIWQQYYEKIFCWILNFVVPDFERVEKGRRGELAAALLKVLCDRPPENMNEYDTKLYRRAVSYARRAKR